MVHAVLRRMLLRACGTEISVWYWKGHMVVQHAVLRSVYACTVCSNFVVHDSVLRLAYCGIECGTEISVLGYGDQGRFVSCIMMFMGERSLFSRYLRDRSLIIDAMM